MKNSINKLLKLINQEESKPYKYIKIDNILLEGKSISTKKKNNPKFENLSQQNKKNRENRI